MINAVGRDIPEAVLQATGKELFQGAYAKAGVEYQKSAPRVRANGDPARDKQAATIAELLKLCEIKDGMTLGFHHHFREGDYVVNMVMAEIHKLGIKGLTICASSLGKAHDPLLPMIEDGTIVGIQSSGVRGKIGEAISTGKLRDIAIMRSHGGRVRAIESGEVPIDIAFIGAPTSDCCGYLCANGGKSDCGVLSYAMVDAQYADKVVAITDCLVPFPNIPASISMVDVDYVVVVEEIGNPAKIASGAAKPTTDLLLEKGLVRKVVDTQDFDLGAIESIKTNPNHVEISGSEYANPFNKGAYVNQLDFVILASLEVDVNFNCNVVVGSDGMITGAQGGHPDTAAGAKCTIVIAPLLQGRIPAICTNVTTVTTPGETVDVVVTDYGVAINPRRPDLMDCLKDTKLPLKTLEELRDMAFSIVGEPDPVQFGERVVGIIESRDGTVIDVVREIKTYEFE